MNRIPNKPRCCYRLLKTISDDIEISERYIKRIITILDKLNIVKYKEMKRNRYLDGEKIFAFQQLQRYSQIIKFTQKMIMAIMLLIKHTVGKMKWKRKLNF